MHTWSLLAPSAAPGARLYRAANLGTSTESHDRRRRLLRALGGPANTAPFHRPPSSARHEQVTRRDVED
jgi:hypothetical protein